MAQPFIPTREPEPLPGTTLLGLRANSLLGIAECIGAGLEPRVLDDLARGLGLERAELLRALGISADSLSRARRTRRRLSPEVSGRAYRLALVADLAGSLLGDEGTLRAWLLTPRAEFGGLTPLEYGVTPVGADHVTTVLHRVRHVVY
jgi:putative toxin-antitoxin system antitoxin component (TIGR02293 family)